MIDVQKIDPKADKESEISNAKAEKLDLLIEYVAMMCDVELPDEEGAEDGEE